MGNDRLVLVLEDNPERVERFTVTLRGLDPCLRLRVWRSARVMLRELGELLSSARLISPDHELDLAGWTYHRVMPLGDDWIEVDWRAVVRKALRRRS